MIELVSVVPGGFPRAPNDGFALFPMAYISDFKNDTNKLAYTLPGARDGIFRIKKGSFIMAYEGLIENPPYVISVAESEYDQHIINFDGIVYIVQYYPVEKK